MDGIASEAPAFTSSGTYVNDEARLALSGEFDMTSSFDADSVVADVVSRQCSRLVVDLALLSFIDSSGISELVKMHAALEGSGIALSIVAPNSSTYRIFELCGLVEQLQVTAT